MTLREDDDLTAAEYALGTLDRAERAAAAMRRFSDADFDRAVADWEDRFAVLSEATAEADPSPAIWTGIQDRLRDLAPSSATVLDAARRIEGLQTQIRRWRAVTGFATAAAAGLALWIAAGVARPPAPAATELVAFLQKSGDEPAYVMGIDFADERLSVRPVAAQAPQGKSYELWVIDPEIGAPRSLGVLDGSVTRHRVPGAIGRTVLARATYAVTLEAAGGSPTGAPTGAPVFTGHLVEAPR